MATTRLRAEPCPRAFCEKSSVIGHRSERMTDLYDHTDLSEELTLLEESREQIEAAVTGRLP